MQREELINKIFESTDSLRGIFSYSDIGQILLLFIFLKRVDCVLQKNKKEVHDFCKLNEDSKELLPKLVKDKFQINYFNNSELNLNHIGVSKDDHYKKFCKYIDGFSPNVKEICNYLLPNYFSENYLDPTNSRIFCK